MSKSVIDANMSAPVMYIQDTCTHNYKVVCSNTKGLNCAYLCGIPQPPNYYYIHYHVETVGGYIQLPGHSQSDERHPDINYFKQESVEKKVILCTLSILCIRERIWIPIILQGRSLILILKTVCQGGITGYPNEILFHIPCIPNGL